MNSIKESVVELMGERFLLGEKLPLDIVTVSKPRVCLIPKNRTVTRKHIELLADNLTNIQTSSGGTPIDHKIREITINILLRALRKEAL
jgi:hypothetical protein